MSSTSTDAYGRPVHKRVSYGKPSTIKKIIVGGINFELTDDDLESEPDNLLLRMTRVSRYGNSEPHLSADPNLFKLIHAHLQGYEILPLPPQGIPTGQGPLQGTSPCLSREATLENLLKDAKDFGLAKLVAKLEKEVVNPRIDVEAKQYRLIITVSFGQNV